MCSVDLKTWSGISVLMCVAFLRSLNITHPRLPLSLRHSSPRSTAGRMVKTGLTASVIISQWTWAATLLQSSNVAWNYGVSGPFWCVRF